MEQGEVGDLFQSKYWPGNGTKCLSWHITISDASYGRRGRCHKIVFRHNVTAGNWVLIIDGRYEASGYEPITSRKFSVSFKLGSNNCYIEAALVNLLYHHELYVDNQIQIPFSRLANSPFTETIPLQITIPTYIIQPESGKNVAFFQIQVKTGYNDFLTIYHRYSEFDILDKCLKSQLDGHLRSSLPSLPGKVFNPFTNQLSEDFLEGRKVALQQYLITLLGNSKAVYYTDFLCFVGVDPITGEKIPI